MAELTNAIQKFFVENSRARHPRDLPRRMPARPRRHRRHELSAADRPGRDVRSRAGRAALRDDGRRSASARHAPGADAGGGRRARAPLGPCRGNLRRRPVPGRPHGNRGRAGLPGRRHFQRQDSTSSPRSSTSPRTASPSPARTAPRRTSRSACCARCSSTTFKQAIQKGGAISVMASYNEIDGVPSHANQWLLRDVLRKEWGFAGFVVSDYFAIRELNERPELFGNHLAADGKAGGGAGGPGGRQHRAAGPGLLPPPRRSGARRADPRSRSSTNLWRRCCCGSSSWACSRIPYVDPDVAERIVGCNRRIANWRSRRRGRRSRC